MKRVQHQIVDNDNINNNNNNQHTSKPCSHLQFQFYLLELRRNKANGQKDTKAPDLE